MIVGLLYLKHHNNYLLIFHLELTHEQIKWWLKIVIKSHDNRLEVDNI